MNIKDNESEECQGKHKSLRDLFECDSCLSIIDDEQE